ncbi:MAG: histidinol dehydrogenase [Thermodesulfovibrionales bacterium]
MIAMKILKKKADIREFISALRKRATGNTLQVEEIVKEILLDIRVNGDKAVIKYTERFDSLKLQELRIRPSEIRRHASIADPSVLEAFDLAEKRIRSFHEMQKEESWSFSQNDTVLGQIVRPLERVGVYVPGGKASYPSTVLMNVIPAQVAGVKEIVLCVPTPRNEVNPYVMAMIDKLGIKEVYRIGGAQAIAAMAYGTETIRKVDKIVGPGNIYVATAKRLVFGDVDIDMIAGPSEILIIADESASPDFIASDLLSQAEHDELASSILITDSATLAKNVKKSLALQLKRLKRKEIAERSLRGYGAIIITGKIKEAVELANEISPEHLEVMTEEPETLLPMIRNAGAIFLGKWTPEPLGDYVAGPNHTLPTGGTARFFSPLGVYDFVKRMSLLKFSKEGFRELASAVMDIAQIEGLTAHGNTIKIRMGKK